MYIRRKKGFSVGTNISFWPPYIATQLDTEETERNKVQENDSQLLKYIQTSFWPIWIEAAAQEPAAHRALVPAGAYGDIGLGHSYKTAGDSISRLGGPPYSPRSSIMSRSLVRINSVWEFGSRRPWFGGKAQVATQLASSD